MDTRGKTNGEFRTEVQEILANHESSFDQVNTTLQQVLTELQALRVTHSPRASSSEFNPFATRETFRSYGEAHSPPLKLPFPKFDGEDPSSWIYKAEQYFEFQRVTLEQQVHIASFHLEGFALQWHSWLTKYRGPLTWPKLTKAVLILSGPTDFDDSC